MRVSLGFIDIRSQMFEAKHFQKKQFTDSWCSNIYKIKLYFLFNDTTACNESDLFIISTKNVDPNKALKSFCLLNFPPIYG